MPAIRVGMRDHSSTHTSLTTPAESRCWQNVSSEAIAVHKELKVLAADVGRALGVTQTVGYPNHPPFSNPKHTCLHPSSPTTKSYFVHLNCTDVRYWSIPTRLAPLQCV